MAEVRKNGWIGPVTIGPSVQMWQSWGGGLSIVRKLDVYYVRPWWGMRGDAGPYPTLEAAQFAAEMLDGA